jgi:hypothetical protein
MSYKPDEKDWMAYLYDEMEEEDKRKFEKYMLQHPEARQELEKYQNLRKILFSAEDKEVIAPPIFVSDNPWANSRGRQLFWHTPYFRMITTVAASLLVVILVGKLTGTQLMVSDHEFRLTFGDVPPTSPVPAGNTASLSPEQVQQMINASVERNNTLVQASLEETQKKLDASIRSNLAQSSGKIDRLVREASSASQDQIRQFVDGIRAENMEQVKDYFQLTSTEQKKYIENILVDFVKYHQEQRNNDLRLVQTRMSSIEQDTDLFKQETEQILSSIITSVGNPVTGEIKN